MRLVHDLVFPTIGQRRPAWSAAAAILGFDFRREVGQRVLALVGRHLLCQPRKLVLRDAPGVTDNLANFLHPRMMVRVWTRALDAFDLVLTLSSTIAAAVSMSGQSTIGSAGLREAASRVASFRTLGLMRA